MPGLASEVYAGLRPVLAGFHYGIDPLEQLAERLSARHFEGATFSVAGLVCPLYLTDPARIEDGFMYAIQGVGTGDLEAYPRYRSKFDRLLGFYRRLGELLPDSFPIKLTVLMGDVGVIGATAHQDKADLERRVSDNMKSYQQYLSTKAPDAKGRVQFTRLSEFTSEYAGFAPALGDLYEMGQWFTQANSSLPGDESAISFPHLNTGVVDQIRYQEVGLASKGYPEALSEPAGFGLAYGIAGLALHHAGTDLLVGTDPPESYLNHLYHLFMEPTDLFVLVPAEDV